MNLQELKNVLPSLLASEITPFLWGQQGVGKTQSIKQYAKEQNLQFVHLHLATQEVGDLVGLLVKDGDTVRHARPTWFPAANAAPGILFLDEANRAHPDVVQAIFSLITEKCIHTHKLPDSWRIIAAGNHDNSEFNVTDTSDAAFLSRFCHIEVTPSAEEFIAYLDSNGAESVANFLREQPGFASQKASLDTVISKLTPNNRAWLQYIAPLEQLESIESVRYELYSGIIGKTAAAAFMTNRTKARERISAKDILNNYPKVQAKVKELFNSSGSRFDLINAAVDELLAGLEGKTLKENQLENIRQLLLDLPAELGIKVIKRLSGLKFEQKDLIVNDKEFVKLYQATKFPDSLNKKDNK